ncbi:hypothetical protein P7K49_011130 [Saguinus oedipus]|uniref:Uncharacterized protein n=1 Tax=Saguinus oedipus TaxID=9490 RepID=A0ABQ9VR50_SAGOE|nr:hypothetical protein P7K49_011130 [Saguinus oedipus]
MQGPELPGIPNAGLDLQRECCKFAKGQGGPERGRSKQAGWCGGERVSDLSSQRIWSLSEKGGRFRTSLPTPSLSPGGQAGWTEPIVWPRTLKRRDFEPKPRPHVCSGSSGFLPRRSPARRRFLPDRERTPARELRDAGRCESRRLRGVERVAPRSGWGAKAAGRSLRAWRTTGSHRRPLGATGPRPSRPAAGVRFLARRWKYLGRTLAPGPAPGWTQLRQGEGNQNPGAGLLAAPSVHPARRPVPPRFPAAPLSCRPGS